MNTVEAAKIIGCSNSTVSRHMRQCVAPNVRDRLQAEAKEFQSVNLLGQLDKSHDVLLQIRDAALSEGRDRVALKAIEVEIKQFELAAKLTGQLNEAPQVNFLLSPEYMQLKQVIIKALEPYPKARQQAARALREVNDESLDQ
jgi:hypothetical protein